jgi:hypothetical protein
MLYNAAGRICVTVGGTVVRTRSGLGFDAADRLCVVLDAAVSRRQGFAFDSAGRLVITATGPFAKASSFEVDAAGRIHAVVT